MGSQVDDWDWDWWQDGLRLNSEHFEIWLHLIVIAIAIWYWCCSRRQLIKYSSFSSFYSRSSSSPPFRSVVDRDKREDSFTTASTPLAPPTPGFGPSPSVSPFPIHPSNLMEIFPRFHHFKMNAYWMMQSMNLRLHVITTQLWIDVI